MLESDLHPTRCAICGTSDNSTELYAANYDGEALRPSIFSARRMPDGIRFRIVRCNTCGLVRSDPIADPGVLDRLYRQSSFDYSTEVESLRQTYGRRLASLVKYNVRKGALLEIGCGTGFLLDEALSQGYAEVQGVEPSVNAVELASPLVRSRIVCDVMRPGLFGEEQFDVVCLFQVFDHIADPGALLDECWKVLKPGGLILCVNHNVKAVSARILGARSPIIDIEHTFLYSPETMGQILRAHGFSVCHVKSIRNRYKLRYLARLCPLPHAAKSRLLNGLENMPIGHITASVPLGNMELVGRKAVRNYP